VKPGEIRAALPSNPPLQGEGFDAILADVEKLLPGITHWQSPNFYAYFPSNASGPSILGDLLSSGLGVQGMLWSTSPACTESKHWSWTGSRACWHYPANSSRPIQVAGHSGHGFERVPCGASCGPGACHRFRHQSARMRREAHSVHLFAAHSSIEKAMMVAGLGRENLRLIDVDQDFAMQPEELARAIDEDKRAGLVPCFVCATVGTTSSNAIDPIEKIGAICREHASGCMWTLHVRHGSLV